MSKLVRGQGYRLVPRVEVLPNESPARHRPRWIVAIGAAISLAAAAAIVFWIVTAQTDARAREQFDRSTSLRGPEPGAGSAVPGGWDRRGNPQPAFESHDASGHCAHVIVLLQGQGRGCPADCRSARRDARSRRQRAKSRRPDPSDGSARGCIRWQAVLVGIVRSRSRTISWRCKFTLPGRLPRSSRRIFKI